MRTCLRKRLFSGFRQLAGALCLAAVTVQLALPVMHVSHEKPHSPALIAPLDAAAALQADVPAGESPQKHDAGTCWLCRTTSELRSLVASTAFLVSARALVASPAPSSASPRAPRITVAELPARAPPVFV